ncbi:MAG: HAMP domain-containing histidine kinase [Ignavibacteriales bacterium]|nr:HAMP domain-containing histidine kinase [Ignavibacteriales bacterium]
MKGKPSSLIIKLILLFLALLIAASTLFYTKHLVKKLQDRERQLVELYAKNYEYMLNPNNENVDLTFSLEIIQQIDFPLIMTDSLDNPTGSRNIELDTNMTEEQINNVLREKINSFGKIHNPITAFQPDSSIIQKLYYGDSAMIEELKYYPYFQILFAILFILVAYISFSYIKRSEQSSIWVGMARETAHQLGTPISSLMGWSEILKMNYKEPEKVTDAAEEIDNDLQRLRKIADRFSKIGSRPELKSEKVIDSINKVMNYFQRRLPHFGKNVDLKISGELKASALLNCELFEWVIENLVKNSLDAIEGKKGVIEIAIAETKKKVEIEVIDNGKGIDFKRRKDIFRPGYSTKRRGWGLGLSLTKRIIEGYHGGKIFLKSSTLNVGSTMKIELRKSH